jgi:heat shock protein HtpX
MPRVYICPQEAPNAFATGRNPRHAAVAVTQGALRLLDHEELEGVIGHELAHVKNRDTLTSTIAATVAGAALIKAMISRSREFVADANGAEIAGSPHGLVSALRKLESYSKRIPMHNPNPAMNNMFIVEPFTGGQTLVNLFASHPPTEKRVAALLGRG